MPNNAKGKTPDQNNPLALSWKNSLLSKEEPEGLQNPINFFTKIIEDNDTFSEIFEEIVQLRSTGKVLPYQSDKQFLSLEAFVIIQDVRGVNWICPVNVKTDLSPQHDLCPLRLANEGETDIVRQVSAPLGNISMMRTDYISACSRGFENASSLLLGDERVTLTNDSRLISAFYIFPQKGK